MIREDLSCGPLVLRGARVLLRGATILPLPADEVSERDVSQPTSIPPSLDRAPSSARCSSSRVVARVAGSKSREVRSPNVALNVLKGRNAMSASVSSVLSGDSMGAPSVSEPSSMICS